MDKKFSRVLSLIMAFLMVLSIFPVQAFAAAGDKTDVVVEVKCGETAVSGASVSIDGLEGSFETDDEGKVTIEDLTEGQKYTAKVTCEGYVEEPKKFTCEADQVVSVELERSKHDIAVTVADEEGNPVSGAAVKLGEEEAVTTDEEGKATLEALVYGTEYSVTVTAEGFKDESVEFICNAETIADGIAAELAKKILDIALSVKNEKDSSVLTGVSAWIGEKEYTDTDADNNLILEKLTYGEEYEVLVKCEGYAPKTVTVLCNDETAAKAVEVKLTPYTKTSVSGTVVCEDAPVAGATVTLKLAENVELTETTDADGKFAFEEVYKELVQSLDVTSTAHKEFSKAAEKIAYGNKENNIKLIRKEFEISAKAVSQNSADKLDNCTVSVSANPAKYGDDVTVTIQVEKVAGVYTHSIYYIMDNGSLVAEDASGTLTYEYIIENVTEKHDVKVCFSKDLEVLNFFVDAEGNLQVEDGEDYKPMPQTIPGLSVEKQPAVNEDGEEITEWRVSYTPRQNYRVSAVKVGDGTEVGFTDNDKKYQEESFTSLEEGEKPVAYTLKIQPNHFKVTVAANENCTVALNPNNDMVNFGRDVELIITPKNDEYYLASITDSVNSDVKVTVNRTGSKLTYTVENVREERTITLNFEKIVEVSDIEGGPLLNKSIPEKIAYDNGNGTYFLGEDAKLIIASVNAGELISENPHTGFAAKLGISDDKKIEALYVSDGTTVKKVECNIVVVVDKTAPTLSYNDDEPIEVSFTVWGKTYYKTLGVMKKYTANDGENGSGIDRVVFKKRPRKAKDYVVENDEILNLPKDNYLKYNEKTGFYVHEIKNQTAEYDYWAIDKVGNISPIVEKQKVDVDHEPPTVENFTIEGYQTFNGVNYPKPSGVTFTVQVTDYTMANKDEEHAVSEVLLHFGGKSFAMTEDVNAYADDIQTFTYTVTPEEGETIAEAFDRILEDNTQNPLEFYVTARDASENKNTAKETEETTVAGNTSDPVYLKVDGSNFQLTLESNSPKVSSIEYDDDVEPVKVDKVNWFKDKENPDVTLTVTIEDTESGLDSSSFKVMNGETEVKNDGTTLKIAYYEEGSSEVRYMARSGMKVVKAELTFNVNNPNQDGSPAAFDFIVEAKDNMGNELIYTSEDSEKLKFSIDGKMPEIKKFDIVAKSEKKKADEESELVKPVGSDKDPVEVTDYGYFFHEAAEILVAADDVGAGVKTIEFYTVAKDGTQSEIQSANAVKNGNRWKATFTVPAGFKGQIYAYAIDEVDNSASAGIGKDAQPKALTITETQDQHDKHSTHVTVTLPETEHKDAKGIALYSMEDLKYDEKGNVVKDKKGNPVKLYENGIPVGIKVTDTFNGIKEITYSLEVPEMAKNEEGQWAPNNKTEVLKDGVINMDAFKQTDVKKNDKGEPVIEVGGITWTLTKTEANLYTVVTGEALLTDNYNNIIFKVAMLDEANNDSESSVELSIDNNAPVLEVSHKPVKEEKQGNKVVMVTNEAANALNPIGETPYFVGFEAQDRKEKDDQYPIYDRSSLWIKVTERNLDLNDKEALVQKAVKFLSGETTEKFTAEDITKDLKVMGPFTDQPVKANNPKKVKRYDAVYPYTKDTYYLIELTDCREVEAGGTYETEFTVTDQNGLSAEVEEFFVIDEFAPEVSISFDNNSARNGNYYNADRTATITVVERNHNNPEAKADCAVSDDGKKVEFDTSLSWSTAEDGITHTATVDFNTDGLYQNFDVDYKDLAGRTGEAGAGDFYIDKTKPQLDITGVTDKSANSGTVAPYISYTDINIDLSSVTVTLTGVNNGVVDYKAIKEAIEHGEKYVYYDFDHVKPVDDIYTLYVRVLDKAGNTSTQTIHFSCNRFGSVFDLSNIQDMLGKYNRENRDIVVTETNVDALDLTKVRVTLTKNGVPVDLVLGSDFTVELVGGEGSWYQYTYTIPAGLFEDDGTYSLYFYTEDAAGNINENIDEIRDAQIAFGIDKTKPIATPVDFESEALYAVESKRVAIEIKDNLQLVDVKIYLNDQEIEYTVEGDRYVFDVPMSNSKQTVRVVAVDAAGNERELYVRDFLVTTSLLIRWYNNTPLFIGSLVLMGLLLALVGRWLFLIFFKRREDEEEEY